MFRFHWVLLLAAFGVLSSSCGPRESSEPRPVTAEGGTPPETAPKEEPAAPFLKLRPPQGESPREPERAVFRIYYDLDGIPEEWIHEWKAGRDLKVEQRPLPADPGDWPRDADLIIAPPDRLIREHLRPFPADAPAARANPLFLHHPFDPGQTLTRPWRWTPWAVIRHTPPADHTDPSTAQPAPTSSATESTPRWPDRPALARAGWLKEMRLSANHPMNPALEQKWTAELERRRKDMEPAALLWEKTTDGRIPSAILPLAWKLRQSGAPVSAQVPPNGALVHFDQLAVALESDQPELALEWVAFLTDPARQKSLPALTGYYPVQVPLGREIPDHTGPPPAWWDRSEFIIGALPPRKSPDAKPTANGVPASTVESETAVRTEAPADAPHPVVIPLGANGTLNDPPAAPPSAAPGSPSSAGPAPQD